MVEKIHVMICDDHPLVLDGLKKLIQEEFLLSGSFGSVNELSSFLASSPEPKEGVLLLDLHLGDGDGMDVCRRLRRERPGWKILGFSGIQDHAVIAHFLRAGANGFLPKTAASEEILHAIHTVAGGGEYLPATLALAIARQQPVQGSSYIPRLSKRELEVLQLIVAENTTQEIADKLFISVNTVETHRNHLLQKLGARNLAGLVRIAVQKGLI